MVDNTVTSTMEESTPTVVDNTFYTPMDMDDAAANSVDATSNEVAAGNNSQPPLNALPSPEVPSLPASPASSERDDVDINDGDRQNNEPPVQSADFGDDEIMVCIEEMMWRADNFEAINDLEDLARQASTF